MKKLIDWSGKVVEKYFRSFDSEPAGYSRTKLVAYAFAAMTMIIQWTWLGCAVFKFVRMLSAGDFLLAAGECEMALSMYNESDRAWDLMEFISITNVSTILSLLGIKAYFKKKDEKIEASKPPEE